MREKELKTARQIAVDDTKQFPFTEYYIREPYFTLAAIKVEDRLQMQMLEKLGATILEKDQFYHPIPQEKLLNLKEMNKNIELELRGELKIPNNPLNLEGGKLKISTQELVRLSETAEISLTSRIKSDQLTSIFKDYRTSPFWDAFKGDMSCDLKISDQGEIKFGDNAEGTSVVKLATQICHTQQVHFFTEGLPDKKKGVQLRKDNLSQSMPTILVSVAGIDYNSGVQFEPEEDKALLKDMWKNAIVSAAANGVQAMAIPPVGLGVYLGSNNIVKVAKVDMYFSALVEAMNDLAKNDKFSIPEIYFNPAQYVTEFETALQKLDSKIKGKLNFYKHDVNSLAVEWSKADILGALVNPSDRSVLFGLVDIGKYHVKGDVAGEEFIGCTSTAIMGSNGISDVYNNPDKIHTFDQTLQAAIEGKKATLLHQELEARPAGFLRSVLNFLSNGWEKIVKTLKELKEFFVDEMQILGTTMPMGPGQEQEQQNQLDEASQSTTFLNFDTSKSLPIPLPKLLENLVNYAIAKKEGEFNSSMLDKFETALNNIPEKKLGDLENLLKDKIKDFNIEQLNELKTFIESNASKESTVYKIFNEQIDFRKQEIGQDSKQRGLIGVFTTKLYNERKKKEAVSYSSQKPNTPGDIKTEVNVDQDHTIQTVEVKGRRSEQEDNYLIAHGNFNLSNEEAAKTFLLKSFKTIDTKIEENKPKEGGATATSTIITKEGMLYAAHLGDSPLVVYRMKADGTMAEPIIIISDKAHHPDNPIEKDRIEKQGGWVDRDRIMNYLAVSRSFGDYNVRCPQFKCLVSKKPEFHSHDLKKYLDKGDRVFVCSSCDGLYENSGFQPKQMSQLILEKIKAKKQNEIAESAKTKAIEAGSGDNITVHFMEVTTNLTKDVALVVSDGHGDNGKVSKTVVDNFDEILKQRHNEQNLSTEQYINL